MESIAIEVVERSQIGEARRTAQALTGRLGFTETAQGKVAIAVTELAQNLVRHACKGVLLLRTCEEADLKIEILAIDRGPGMTNPDACLRDGFSTTGTAGNGLGAVQRLADEFGIYSTEAGTVVVAQIRHGTQAHPAIASRLQTGVVCLHKAGETVTGDAWSTVATGQYRSVLLVADGIGHGPAAANASAAAVRVFQEQAQQPPQAILETAHGALRRTRGAVLAIAAIDFEQSSVQFAGVGNVAATVLTARKHHSLISYEGTAGYEVRKIREFVYPWYEDGLLVMHSDGLGSKWRLDQYPGLRQQHPSIIAGVLWRDFDRGRDDVTVLVAKER